MQWKFSEGLIGYPEAVAFMEDRVADIHAGTADELVWFLQHPPIYTGGTSAKAADLLTTEFPVYETGRGGEYTYHGPGQLVAYVMLDLRKRQSEPDLKAYIHNLEEWIIRSLREIGIKGERRSGRVGIWVDHEGREDKIAAIGVRIRRWITYHGVAINIDPDLSHYTGIVPCGIKEHGICSAASLGRPVQIFDFQKIMQNQWIDAFGSIGQPAVADD